MNYSLVILSHLCGPFDIGYFSFDVVLCPVGIQGILSRGLLSIVVLLWFHLLATYEVGFPWIRSNCVCLRLGGKSVFPGQGSAAFAIFSYSRTMDCSGCHANCLSDIHDIHSALHRHGGLINDNRISIFSVTSKVHSSEHQYLS